MAFSEGHKLNFETLKAAKNNDDLCLLEVYERIGGAPVTIVCATYTDEEGNINFVPLARMLDQDPYTTLVTTPDMVAKYWGNKEEPFIHVEGSARQIPISSASYDIRLAGMILAWQLQHNPRASALRHQFAEEVVSKLPEEWSRRVDSSRRGQGISDAKAIYVIFIGSGQSLRSTHLFRKKRNMMPRLKREKLARELEMKFKLELELLTEMAAAYRQEGKPVPAQVGEAIGAVAYRQRCFQQVKRVLLESSSGIGTKKIVERFLDEIKPHTETIQRLLELHAQ
jgi:hypothetical protein